MLYEFNKASVQTQSLEYSVSYHCNLKCAGCSHLSPFSNRLFPSLESFSKDLNQLAKIMHTRVLRLLGGEPMLNPEINEFIKTARASGIADKIMVTTNGTLIHKMNDEFWKDIDFVLVTLYAGVSVRESFDLLRRKARFFKTHLWFQFVSKFRTTIVTRPHPKDWITQIIFKTCRDAHLFHCHMVHEGKMYKCAVPPFLCNYIHRMGLIGYDPTVDSFDIYDGDADPYERLKKYLLSTNPMEACRYCLGYLGREMPHHQMSDDFVLRPQGLNIDRKNSLDGNRFLREGLLHYKRRFVEKFTGRRHW